MRCGLKNAWGLVAHPYAFFEEAIRKGNPIPATIFFAVGFLLTYSGWWIVRGGPFLTSDYRHIFSLIVPLLTYPAAVIIIFLVCRILERDIRLRSFFATWGYSYLPTLAYFLIDIMLRGLARVPWFASVLQLPVLIMVLWTLLQLMFLWKLLFLAITLRLAGNLNLGQIIAAMFILAFFIGIYWAGIFSLGWLKIPFI